MLNTNEIAKSGKSVLKEDVNKTQTADDHKSKQLNANVSGSSFSIDNILVKSQVPPQQTNEQFVSNDFLNRKSIQHQQQHLLMNSLSSIYNFLPSITMNKSYNQSELLAMFYNGLLNSLKSFKI